MRVVRPAATKQWSLPRRATIGGRAARIERLGLAGTSLVLLFGLALAAAGQLSTMPSCEPARGCVNLNTLQRPEDLAPALTTFPDAERTALAAVLTGAVVERRAGGDLTHVGVLASLTVPAATVKRTPQLTSINERLRARPARTDVPILSGAELAGLKPSLTVRTRGDYVWRVAGVASVFLLSFWLLHGIRWWFGTTGDAVLLPAVQLLSGLGLMTLLALRDPLRDMPIAWTMTGGIAAGCVLWAAISSLDFERAALRRAVLLPIGVAVALAAVLVLFGSGPTGSSARVNLFGVQPVELIRPLVVLGLAAYFARRWQFLRAFSEDLGGPAPVHRFVRLPRWKDVRPLAITLATLLLFFFLQKDLGPALVLSCVFLALYGLARGHAALVAAGVLVLAAGFAAGYALGIPATVAQRVTMWLDPWENALRGGDQVAHALWAFSSGGAWGLGPGVGDPNLIPAGHTDLVLAALGEELGFIGVAAVLFTLGLVVWRMLGIALRAPGDYTLFIGTGLAVALAAQALVIVAGQLDLLPLAGVVTPFLSFGRSSMLSNFAAVAIVAAIARRQGPARASFAVPVNAVRWTLACAALVLLVRAGQVQTLAADSVAAASVLTQQADGGLRYQPNPRLVAAAQAIPRGTIFDRSGLPLATSEPRVVAAAADRLRALGLPVSCPVGQRCYPLGGGAFHLLGHADSRLNWAASNTAYAEQEFDAPLSGFDDRARTVDVRHPRDGRTVRALRRDYRDLLPLVRHKGDPSHPDVRRILDTPRDVHLSVDAALQVETARAVRAQALAAGSGRAAAVVVDPRTGELLAAASYPWPEDAQMRGGGVPTATLLDRARFGLYPPGSTFKLVTAAAALRAGDGHGHATYQCMRLPDGRVGNRVAGTTVRDDVQDAVPHGTVDLDRALIVSCNAYFAQLASRIGPEALRETAAAARITVAAPETEARLRRTLPQAGYGQGDVIATPQRMARVVAAVASDGTLREITMRRQDAASAPTGGTTWLDGPSAARLRRDMRQVVTSGSGRSLASHPVAIGGKTGTAEVDGDRSHAWFVGYAPYGSTTPARIAFAVIVENGGYGGRVATPVAAALVTAAEKRGLLRPPAAPRPQEQP